jgi:hypothetical protein
MPNENPTNMKSTKLKWADCDVKWITRDWAMIHQKLEETYGKKAEGGRPRDFGNGKRHWAAPAPSSGGRY